MITLPKNRPPTHPGEMLREEFLVPLGMTQTELAERIGVSYVRINELVNWDLWHAMRAPEAEDIGRIEPVEV